MNAIASYAINGAPMIRCTRCMSQEDHAPVACEDNHYNKAAARPLHWTSDPVQSAPIWKGKLTDNKYVELKILAFPEATG